MLNWCSRFNIFCFLDNPSNAGTSFEILAAAGAERSVQANAGNAFTALRDFYKTTGQNWLFGHFGYDLKNELFSLNSRHAEANGFSDLYFFIPQIVLRLEETSLVIFAAEDHERIFDEVCSMPGSIRGHHKPVTAVQNRISRGEYLDIIEKLRQHILRGDCYEINFCQEFYASAAIDPEFVYEQLLSVSPNPFAALYRINDDYCICASPERYLKKTGDILLSQPIKGTARRDHYSRENDEASKQRLIASEKERSENVMIVDLVRNDLSRVCTEGSVRVEELFGLYSFPQVHQMISSVTGRLQPGLSWIDAVAASFPMGSMTGAPKKRVLELVDEYEAGRRGLFSGAIGYVDPGGDFDFNVVIRSLFYNNASQYLSFQAGGAITFHSKGEEEYDESLLKAEAIRGVIK